MSEGKATLKTIDGKEIAIMEQIPIPCFRCGICCTCYHAPLTPEDIGHIASALGISRSKFISRYAIKVPIKEGYLLKHTKIGCVFLAWDTEGKSRCTIYRSRPKACREWTPSLAKHECLEGLAKLKSRRQIMLPDELLPSQEERKEFYHSLEKVSSQSYPTPFSNTASFPAPNVQDILEKK